MTTRTEHDSFGPIEVPAQRLWGAQTQRSLQNFDISGERQATELIHALARVKRASARVNHRLGLLSAELSGAIAAVASGHVTAEQFDAWVVPAQMTGL